MTNPQICIAIYGPNAPQVFAFKDANIETSLVLLVNDLLQIHLPEHLTLHSAWEIEALPKNLKLLDSALIPDVEERSDFNKLVLREMNFKAIQTGAGKLIISWTDKEEIVKRILSIDITIKSEVI